MTKDKICIDLSDVPEVAELLSRKQPGDSVKFKGEATVDEAKDGMAVLSIKDISFSGAAAPATKPDKATKSAAVQMFSEDAEEAEPEEEPSATSE